MSEVISFRLCDNNPREAQAREVIQTWTYQGYPLHYIITGALIHLRDKDNHQKERIDFILRMFTQLLEQIEGRQETAKMELIKEAENSATFIESVLEALKPGVKINRLQHPNR